jgi:hypothetical protein
MEQITAGGADSGRTWGWDKGADDGKSHLTEHDRPADHSRAISSVSTSHGYTVNGNHF